MKQRMQFCSSRDGVRIAFATAGQGPPLVRVNNWFTHLEIDWDSPVWRHWLEAFVERRMLIRYDPRGSGLSDRDAADYSFDAWVARHVLAAATAASRLSRTLAILAETLRRLRSSSSQIIQIERVNVWDGCQAVIGNIKHGGSHENG